MVRGLKLAAFGGKTADRVALSFQTSHFSRRYSGIAGAWPVHSSGYGTT